MIAARKQFAHVVLFYCPRCRGPIASAFSTSDASAVCRCGWIGNGLDLTAVNQSIQPWEAICEAPEPSPRETAGANTSNSDNWLFRVAKEIASLSKKLKAQPAGV
ncbi:MAG: hypothetical protein M3P45_02825 [Acidobacteriota bacterium]|nr:hypothetical protein [Acidobacteriota bacterium]